MKITLMMFLASISIYAQTSINDTIYIKWNDTFDEMRSSERFNFRIVEKTKQNLSHFFSVYKEDEDFRLLMFIHIISATDEKAIKMAGGEIINPIKKTVDSTFLKNKNVLDIQFFRNHTYEEIYNKFSTCNCTIFIYDECEVKSNVIVLKEVGMLKEINE